MKPVHRSLAILGMAKKAGLLVAGAEAAAHAARRGKARLIITASDASETSIRRAKSNAEVNRVKYSATPFTMLQLGIYAGRGSPGTIAFLDKGLADEFIKKMAETEDKSKANAKDKKESDA